MMACCSGSVQPAALSFPDLSGLGNTASRLDFYKNSIILSSMKSLDEATSKRLDMKTAKTVQALFKDKILEADRRCQQGDTNASHEFMSLITQKGWALRRLGLMENDHGRLVKFKPWTPPEHLVFKA
jgi:hypothetical protein